MEGRALATYAAGTGTTRRLVLTRASDIKPAARGTRRLEWGPWDIDRVACVLWTTAPGYRYEISLEGCTSSAGVLDAICQVAGKQWDDRDRLIAGLVTALDDVLSPQARLCPWGRSRRLSRPAIRALVRNAPTGSGQAPASGRGPS